MGSHSPNRDKIRISDLALSVSLKGGSRWESEGHILQPILLSFAISFDFSKVVETDALLDTIDYGLFSRQVTELLSAGCFDSLEELADVIFRFAFQNHMDISELDVKVIQVKAPLHAKQVGLECSRKRGSDHALRRYFVDELVCTTIVGANMCERNQKQDICLELTVQSSHGQKLHHPFDYRRLTRMIYDDVGKTSYQTLEALASFIVMKILHNNFTVDDQDIVTVKAAKPSALIFARSAEVEITRQRRDLLRETFPNALAPELRADSVAAVDSLPPSHDSATFSKTTHLAAIALGSNLGDRFANIEYALRLLETSETYSDAKVAITNTSFMYETAPMYVTDQPSFINCACIIETNLGPRYLLSVLKKIEKDVGRVPSIRNGPRAVDLDILTYDSQVIDTRDHTARSNLDNLEGELVVPHPRMSEREFVLRPLNDMIPEFIHPVLNQPIHILLDDLVKTLPADAWPMKKTMPFPRYPHVKTSDSMTPPTATYWTFPLSSTPPRKTYIMGTLNATPDSFSDGSKNNSIPAALSYIADSIAGGADIVDIGGYSTRPGAAYVSVQEEISRVVPIVEALRNNKGSSKAKAKLNDVLISVDTFRYDVAKAAILAGANCLNDVCAFVGPDYPLTPASWEHLHQMRQAARDLAVPVILMHSRGEAGSNKDYSSYGPRGVLEGIQVELGKKVDAIVEGPGGVRRWLVMIDPGVGFSKSVQDNLQILRHASSFTAPGTVVRNPLCGFPQLVGASKKSFLGLILAQPDGQGTYEGRKTEPDERGWATAAAVACAVQQGAAVVRVHDALEMGDVVRVGNLLWG